MSLSRNVRCRAVVDTTPTKILRIAGQDASLIETLEPRVLLSAGFDMGNMPIVGPEPSVGQGVEIVAWHGAPIKKIKGSWLLTFDQHYSNDRAEALAREAANATGEQLTNVKVIGRGRWASITLNSTPSQDALDATTNAFDWLLATEPDLVYQTDKIPDDALFGNQWQHDNTGQFVPGSGFGVVGADPNILSAWDITTGSKDAIIAVIDTGVDLQHPDLAPNIWVNPGEIAGNGIDDDGNGFVDDVNGWDFGEGDNNPDDVAGHGTMVAGTLGAVGNNGIGAAGVNWDVSILPMKIADASGGLSASAIIGAHDYLTMMITDFNINIVASNNSYGAFAPSFFLDQFPDGLFGEKSAIESFIAAGATFVAAAGNEGNDNDANFTSYPAAYDIPGIVAVAASNNKDALAGFSNFGAQTVDLAAPGEQIFTTINGGLYGYVSGTSFSSPYVAGTVGLLKTFRPDASAVEIRQALIDSSDILPAFQGRVVSGGRLNVLRALQIIGTDGPIAIGFDPGPVTARTNSNTGLPIDTITVTFNKDIQPTTLDSSAALLTYAGTDGLFGTADDSDSLIPVSDVALQSGQTNVVDVSLTLTGVPQQRLPLGNYRVTLFAGTSSAPKFQDLNGNLLNGNGTSGTDEKYDFEVIGVGGNLEPNDSLAQATPVAFTGSGSAAFASVTLGDGLSAGLDVDLYKITLPKGGLITAEITAANLNLPSTLDSYIRLFDANGVELASNDQFNGRDSFLDFFVTTGGTYFVGVSGFPNFDYNPNAAGSGRSQSNGVYNIDFGYQQIADDRLTVPDNITDPLPVPAVGTQGTQSSTITVTDARQIKDLNLRLDLKHSFVSDLEITLIAPDGTEQIIFNQHGTDGHDFDNLLFDDEASSSVVDATAPYTGSLKPTNSLNKFDGKLAVGTWTLLIRDKVALGSGQLNSWSLDFTLENNIFGAFESNDTLATARSLSEIVGTGSASRSATIGDGGFGTLDRDLFRISVDEGATLNASVTSTAADSNSDPTLNTGLRLFDELGNELKSASPAGTLNANLTSFVFSAGGIYYIGVSEGSNVNYDPFDVTSGTAAVTTGTYTLNVIVSPGLSDAAAVFDRTNLKVGIASDGSLGSTDSAGNPVGITFNTIDFLENQSTGGGLNSFYSFTANGFDFLNDGQQGATALPVSLTNESDPSNSRISANGLFRDISIQRTVTLGENDNFLVFDVLLTNNALTDATNVSWLEAFNPNQGLNLITSSANTSNTVDSDGKYASASVVTNLHPLGITVALAAPAADNRALATFVDQNTLVVRDPSQVLDFGRNDPAGTSSDLLMSLAYNIGTLKAGQSTTLRYFAFLGDSPAQAQAMYDKVNAGTGTGHLTADPATPATETLSNGETAPTLSYDYYYPEGFASPNIFSFVPMINPNDEATRVVVIARYETGERDDLIADFTIPAQSRGGITTNTPDLFNIGFGNAGGSLVRPFEPYSLEIRAERPIAANFTYYDTFLLDGARAALGESFTSQTSDTWSFGTVVKEDGRFDIPIFLNTSDNTVKVTATLLPSDGGSEIVLTKQVEPHRRSGWNLSAVDAVPNGTYGLIIKSPDKIVAALSSFDSGKTSGNVSAAGTTGMPGIGAIRGDTPEGQIGLNSAQEIIGITNANTASTEVIFSFIFEGGSAYRTNLIVSGRSRSELDVSLLPNFPKGQAYSISYSSTLPVAMSLPSQVFNDGIGTSFSANAYTLWAFGEGFRPQNGFDQNVTEYLRLFNPAETDVIVEITIRFDGNFKGTSTPLGQETFRRTIPARRVSEFDIHEFVTGDRRLQDVFYGMTIKSALPIVAYVGRFDSFFPGAFGTLGVPMGVIQSV